MINLRNGAKSADGKSSVEIIDQDKFWYLVKNISRGASGVRTISKKFLEEFVAYFSVNPTVFAVNRREEHIVVM